MHTPRGGNVRDLWRLQHQLGYSIYRLNVHTNQEIFNVKGANVNEHMSPQHPAWEPLHFVRAMRRVERLRNRTRLDEYSSLLGWAQSILATAEDLLPQVAKHHVLDLELAKAGGPGPMLAVLQ